MDKKFLHINNSKEFNGFPGEERWFWNVIPAIEDRLKQPFHNELFFDENDNRWAIRQDKWKLVSVKSSLNLYNLEADIGEKMTLLLKNQTKEST